MLAPRRRRRARGPLLVSAAVVLALPLLSAGPLSSAEAATGCAAPSARTIVGSTAAGVEVRDSAGSQLVTRASLGLEPTPTWGFGRSVAQLKLGAGACQLLIVGDGAAYGAPSSVHLIFDGPDGFGSGEATRTLTAPVPQGNDDFGHALALTPRQPAVAGVTDVDLWIGAPGKQVNGLVNAGAIERYRLTYDSRVADPDLTVTHLQTITQNSPGIPAVANDYTEFGEVLAPALAGMTDRWGLLVGTPLEDVGTLKNAGMVTALTYSADGTTLGRLSSLGLTQATPGIAGKLEAYDWFGSAVTDRLIGKKPKQVITIGTPGEDVGTIKDAGSVEDTEGLSLQQGENGVQGHPNRLDRFGNSLAWSRLPRPCATCALPAPVLVVGVPGEDVGTIKDAGAVQFGKTLLWQGHGFVGKAETGDRHGEEMAVQANSSLLISSPSEDLSGLYNTGQVYSVPRTATAASLIATPPTAFTFSTGAVRAARYGAILGN
jgi:hypothetical protein